MVGARRFWRVLTLVALLTVAVLLAVLGRWRPVRNHVSSNVPTSNVPNQVAAGAPGTSRNQVELGGSVGPGTNEVARGEGRNQVVGYGGVGGALGVRDAGNVVASPVVRMMRLTGEADRRLLVESERLVPGGASSAVRELLALRRAGANREALERHIADRLASPVALRLAAGRWLNTVSPVDRAPTTNQVPKEFGGGGGPVRVQPVQRRQ